VFLSTIMVLSVVAIGVAGFAGFAAAASSANVSNATIAANPAGVDVTGDAVGHVATLDVTDVSSTFEVGSDTSSAGDTFNITFDGTSNIEYDGVGDSNVIIELIDDGSVTKTYDTNTEVKSATADGKIEVGANSNANDQDLTDITTIRVIIATNIDHNSLDTGNDLSARLALDLTHGDSSDGVEFADTPELAVGSNAPITMDASENDGTNYTSLAEAVEDIDSTNTERITVRGDVGDVEGLVDVTVVVDSTLGDEVDGVASYLRPVDFHSQFLLRVFCYQFRCHRFDVSDQSASPCVNDGRVRVGPVSEEETKVR
jgi:hypothetical protein